MTEARSARTALAARLAGAGCVAPFAEVDDLIEAANGDELALDHLISRRVKGEPLAWVTGWTTFAGHRVRVDQGVYVPRRQTEALVRRAVRALPERGLAADLCTGSGAIALALARARPRARVVASDVDPVACCCAAANGVEVFAGHLAEPLPAELSGRFDVVVAVAPYVPTAAMEFLAHDVREHEPVLALDGGPLGTRVLEQAVGAAAGLLHRGGCLLLELGGDQAQLLSPVLAAAGFNPPALVVDAEGDLRGIEAERR